MTLYLYLLPTTIYDTVSPFSVDDEVGRNTKPDVLCSSARVVVEYDTSDLNTVTGMHRNNDVNSPVWWPRISWYLHELLYYTRLTALFPGLPGWASTRKVKPIWILLKQETVSGSGISWAVCKSAPRSRQIIMPAPHHSFLQAGCRSCRPTNSVKALKDCFISEINQSTTFISARKTHTQTYAPI